jgi:XTP/dITP diphosphohydrolase
MPRKLTEKRLVIASHNEGKVREIKDLLGSLGVVVVGASELGLEEPEETEKTFIGNAKLKALAAARGSNLPALADDSGLEVTALGGAPGIFSARWAGPAKDFRAAMDRVERELGSASDRSARFVCALALAWPDEECEAFEGEVRGSLVFPPRGTKGFGYDPIFVPAGDRRTFGEIDPEEKHRMSHRADAFRKLMNACF